MSDFEDEPRDAIGVSHPLVSVARSLLPCLRERRGETSELRKLPDSTVVELRQSGLLSAQVPKDYGGSETSLHTFFDIVQELGRADGSVAWTYAILSCGSWMVSTFFSEIVARDVFESQNPLTSAVMVPNKVSAVRVDGGMHISEGRWTFNSGVQHSGWNIVGVPVFGPEGSPIDLVSGVVPTDQLRLLDDWRSVGLRGSGSSTVVAEDVFIPDVRLVSHSDLLRDEYPPDRAGKSPLYRMPVVPTVMIKMAAPSIAIARGALEKFIETAPKRQIAMTYYRKQSEAAVTHLQVAEAAAKIDAAETITRRSITELEAASAAGRNLTREEKARIWRDAAFACRLSWEAMDRLADASGGSFAREENPLSQAWRDIRTAISHAGLCTTTSYEIFGRVAFDLPSNSPLLPG
ncbi:acyl-CoA dehydrogenase family protein [Pararhizobium qamdonense]|uniref:acyl-CoA dehydrogenase family protein n=1 Tax=Pararhizobium qamdonense TaxID=3031126 RepID=UPI0023E27064|nr:acyl-CoA dehydrogenase family protein [Pararhizobium qamdonense]